MISIDDAASRVGMVDSNGTDEAAVRFDLSRKLVDVNALVRKARNHGTSGNLSIDEPGQLFHIVISTRCTWHVRISQSLPGHDPMAGSWRYLKTVPRREAEEMGLRFTAAQSRPPIGRERAINIYVHSLFTAAIPRNPARVTREALLARVHSPSDAEINGCLCWTLVREPRTADQVDLAFVDGRTGKIRGGIQMRKRG